MPHILIVEDDTTFAMLLKTWLGKKGYKADTAGTVAAAARMLFAADSVDVVLSDLRLPDHDGLELLGQMRKRGLRQPFIVMTSYAEVQNAVLAMKSGASDYIAKPVQPDILLQKIEDAMASAAATDSGASVGRPAALPADKRHGAAADMPASSVPQYLDGTSEASRRLYDYVSLVAPTPMSVLILGASGTGKEHVARRIHNGSRRSAGPFVAIDCGAVPRDVAASEFFGHVKGAFTGAVTDKRGAFVEASGGTLFLDEVGNLSYDVQVQLLRAIQERRVRPVGSAAEIEVDIRLVCATNENLSEAVAAGTFREDLYHRINEFTIAMPELKDRGADLLLFADLFMRQANEELDRNVEGFDASASEKLTRHTWPGNLREMKNTIKRAVLLARGNRITAADLDIVVPVTAANVRPLHDAGSELERIKAALQYAGGNKSLAARQLGIDRKTLYNKMDKYGMNR
ncbi:sigma-54 dependent transcriptional regulator [Prevotella sp. PTAC]|uniref:sigma-54-dependent transcriptional regulator n=1 Tax=Prevotella sp. PTAC TaxID=2736295 RepID=UPI0015573229|nr:sigma-54 dependent transcriptional regulator [Prevotella sp. PTAC]NPD53800.1 sigma-54-dependent Fis family transcriptional regulator [Prevotella sp. PTAC]